MKFLSIFTGNKGAGILSEPGDTLDARITKSGIGVVKVSKDGGNIKYSLTRYTNGTTVETKVKK